MKLAKTSLHAMAGLCFPWAALTAAILPRDACSSLSAPDIAGLTVEGFRAERFLNVTVPSTPPLLPVTVSGLDICSVEVNITHGTDANDHVRVLVWLPLTGWNKRFLGTGGSGFAPGLFELALAPVVAQGFAAASTDAGVGVNPYTPAAWALKDDSTVNEALLENFASRSVHDMTVIGKALTAQFYGTTDYFSYWNGCSTGGRQGVQSAQTHPDDFDGVLAGAPAINWAAYTLAGHWPQSVMLEEGYVSVCELDAFTAAAVAACDHLDGLTDGIITDPALCDFDPFEVVGRAIPCDPATEAGEFTATAARVVSRIWQGPAWWYGVEKGAPLSYLANSLVLDNGTRVGVPFFVDDAWIKYFLTRDPSFDTAAGVDTSTLRQLFHQSLTQYDSIIGASDPYLARFAAGGNKLLLWHGLADQLIFPRGTVRYVEEVARANGTQNVGDFLRLFLAPGVDHCGGGTTPGPVPLDALDALIRWVERGVAPDTLPASSLASSTSNGTTQRPLCAYPARQVYRGTNATDIANGDFECVLP